MKYNIIFFFLHILCIFLNCLNFFSVLLRGLNFYFVYIMVI